MRWRGDVRWLAAVVLAACGTAGYPASRESSLVGAWPKNGCFHVAPGGPTTYRFVIDEVKYGSARAPGGDVGIVVRAVGYGDLQPRPVVLPRTRRLVFEAEGAAGGEFELTLFLIDPDGTDHEPRTLTKICERGIR